MKNYNESVIIMILILLISIAIMVGYYMITQSVS